MKLRLSVEAEEDLISIYVYGAATFGVAQAERYYAELRAAMELITRTPLIAREHREFKPSVRVHPHGRHLIIYREIGDGILVVRLVNSRQNWVRLFDDRVE